MKPLVILAFSLAVAFAVGCDEVVDAPLQINPGNHVVTYYVKGAT